MASRPLARGSIDLAALRPVKADEKPWRALDTMAFLFVTTALAWGAITALVNAVAQARGF